MNQTSPPQRRTPEASHSFKGCPRQTPDTTKSLAALMVLGIDALVNRDAIECTPVH
jgi:hypothetical protein